MSTLNCSEFIDQLERWMEGERPPQARAHAQDCSLCRGFAEDLDAIQSSAPALSVADPEPPARIWAALRVQLSDEGLIREPSRIEPVHVAPARSSWLEGWLALVPRPAVAAAYLILLCALALGLAAPPQGVRNAQTASFPLSTQLESA